MTTIAIALTKFMFSLLGILSQQNNMAYSLTGYDKAIVADTPLLYLPLTRNSYSNDFFNSYYYDGSIDLGSSAKPSASNPILNNTSNSTLFSVTPFLTINKSVSSGLNFYQNKSLEFWMQYKTGGGTELIADNYNSNNSCQFTVSVNDGSIGSGSNKIALSRNAGPWTNYTSNGTLTANSIYHVVFTWDTSTCNLYLNGSLDKSASWTTFSKSTGQIYIGKGHNLSTNPNSFISHVAFYDYVLNSTKVTAHYNARL
jgi:hypothetical protein